MRKFAFLFILLSLSLSFAAESQTETLLECHTYSSYRQILVTRENNRLNLSISDPYGRSYDFKLSERQWQRQEITLPCIRVTPLQKNCGKLFKLAEDTRWSYLVTSPGFSSDGHCRRIEPAQ